MEHAIALLALTVMEIVLGIDNIVFIAILTDRLPEKQQAPARRIGLGAAMVMRILLLLCISAVLGLTEPLLSLSELGLPESWLSEEIDEISVRDLILLTGGLFLIWKSVREIHHKVEGNEHEHAVGEQVSFGSVLFQIAILDIVFSLDSVITAVGMAKEIWVMVVAVVLAVIMMLIFADKVSMFVKRHPTLKMLALSFLILIGVMLVAEGIGTHIDKGYIYFAMAFAVMVEFLNIKVRTRRRLPAPL